jgi:hypothetical protein
MVAAIRKSWLLLLFVLASVSLSVPGLRADDLPLDLSLIGHEHVGFVQVRLADLWKSESFVPMRMLVEKAGPEMLAVFDQRFVPAPSSVDRITLIFAANPQGPGQVPEPVIVVTTSRPFDLSKLVKGLLPESETLKNNKKCYVDANRGTALCVLDERTFAMGPSEAVTKLAPKPHGQAGQLQRGVDLAAKGESLVAASSWKISCRRFDKCLFLRSYWLSRKRKRSWSPPGWRRIRTSTANWNSRMPSMPRPGNREHAWRSPWPNNNCKPPKPRWRR